MRADQGKKAEREKWAMEQRKRGKKSQEERCGCFQTCTHASRTHWHASAKRAAQTEHYWKLCVGERLEKELMVAQFTIEPLIFPCNLLRLLLRLIHNLKFIPPLSLWHTLIVTLLSRFPTSYSCNTASHHQPLSLSSHSVFLIFSSHSSSNHTSLYFRFLLLLLDALRHYNTYLTLPSICSSPTP